MSFGNVVFLSPLLPLLYGKRKLWLDDFMMA
jgi:hypothetical protein